MRSGFVKGSAGQSRALCGAQQQKCRSLETEMRNCLWEAFPGAGEGVSAAFSLSKW